MTRCGFGYPVSPGSRHVFFCNDEAVDSFTQPVPGTSSVSVRVRVCDEHAEWLRREYLLQHATSRPELPLPCVCGDPASPGVHHRLSGPCHVDLGVETHEIMTSGGEHVATVVTRHEHTEAECGHIVPDLTTDGELSCWVCGERKHESPTSWCHVRCAVFHAEVVESVKLAERDGDILVSADEMMTDREDDAR